ncbi:uncharacterized protein M421DRAFT_219252 [Didymella exigua CBS 183.55]|uniref:Uncharacterized protein n=1 Tax=Didymella exigua CBS 183.55 TaxID=1150837 RepID=A0A6A5RFG9_9PLEO|nr:uncharacterized protein M421DRAFT_219252 [Didymella exigua CBS 183.55]KAF1926199.1 hypothetical protein M421DRAFT_219252 [Didymella exigua CBS 183.55]
MRIVSGWGCGCAGVVTVLVWECCSFARVRRQNGTLILGPLSARRVYTRIGGLCVFDGPTWSWMQSTCRLPLSRWCTAPTLTWTAPSKILRHRLEAVRTVWRDETPCDAGPDIPALHNGRDRLHDGRRASARHSPHA